MEVCCVVLYFQTTLEKTENNINYFGVFAISFYEVENFIGVSASTTIIRSTSGLVRQIVDD